MGNQEKSTRGFEVFDAEMDGTIAKFKVYEPNTTQQREATKIRNRTFYDAVQSGAFLKMQIKDLMRERDLWDDAKQNEYAVLESKILDGKDKLDQGGFKLSEAKELALNMHVWRTELVTMTVDESQLTNETAEGQADNASFNYLVSACVVYNDNEQPVFSGMDDYLNRSTTDLAVKAARCLAALLYGVRSDIEKQLPENVFLLEYGFIDDDLRLINEAGELVNAVGEQVDQDGFVIGTIKEVERKPFLDDSGKIVKTKQEQQEQQELQQESQQESQKQKIAKTTKPTIKSKTKKAAKIIVT